MGYEGQGRWLIGLDWYGWVAVRGLSRLGLQVRAAQRSELEGRSERAQQDGCSTEVHGFNVHGGCRAGAATSVRGCEGLVQTREGQRLRKAW